MLYPGMVHGFLLFTEFLEDGRRALRGGRTFPGSCHDRSDGLASGPAGVQPMTGHTDRFAGKVAVVTGAASGIGRAIAVRFVAEGAKCRPGRLQLGQGWALSPNLSGNSALPVAGDISQPADVERFVRRGLEQVRLSGRPCQLRSDLPREPLPRAQP